MEFVDFGSVLKKEEMLKDIDKTKEIAKKDGYDFYWKLKN